MAILIAGIDEAGRGPVIGPMVICIAVASNEAAQALASRGVRDSKLLAPSTREHLKGDIEALCEEIRTITIPASEINEYMRKRISLNEMEAEKMGNALNALHTKPRRVYVDAPDPDEKMFEKRIRRYYTGGAHLVCAHYADKRYPIVSAASVVAKVTRDAEIERIKEELGADFGSGYSSDERTITFLEKNYKREDVRKYLRTRWATVKRLSQKKLGEF